jgi:putative transcriptional regulator
MASQYGHFLDGKLLIAMPGIGDPRFERSVIFLCAHSSEGAMGIVVNKVAPNITFSELLERLEVLPAKGQIRLPPSVSKIPVQFGGPVETGRGFVLHSSDYYSADTTLPISDKVGLTATLDVLRAIAQGHGPKRSLLALGYAGWGPGQLENEIQRNGWLHCDSDEDVVFRLENEQKYAAALKKIGVDPRMLSTDAGHA